MVVTVTSVTKNEMINYFDSDRIVYGRLRVPVTGRVSLRLNSLAEKRNERLRFPALSNRTNF
jgi:hypothetical protein